MWSSKQRNRVNPASGLNYCIRAAAYNGNSELVELLLRDERVDATAKENYAVKNAHEKGYSDIVEMLEGWVGKNGEMVLKMSENN